MSEGTKNNNSIFVIIITILLLIIAVLAFFIGKNYDVIFGGSTNSQKTETLTVELIGDKRNSEISLEQFEQSLAQQPSMRNVTFVKKDFLDEGVKKYLQDNEITKLPAVIFSTKNFDNSLDPQNLKVYLKELKDGRFTLEVGAKYDPFSVNERGFNTVKGDILTDSHIKGNKNAKISILEYTDIECPYCIRFHQTTYLDDMLAANPDNLNVVLKHFPLNFHPNAKPGAELLECFADQKGEEAFYKLADIIFKEGKSDKDFIIEKAVELGADKKVLETCYSEHKFAKKVEKDASLGAEKFQVGGTPTLIIYNKETGEYKKATRNIEQDKKIIEDLLK